MWKCTVCGHEHDEEDEGVPFADLPVDWYCPVRGAPSDQFEQIS
ncbi:MAG: rubredoxin [Thermoleophilia bacterium]